MDTEDDTQVHKAPDAYRAPPPVFQDGWEYLDEIHGWTSVPKYLIGKVLPPNLFVRESKRKLT